MFFQEIVRNRRIADAVAVVADSHHLADEIIGAVLQCFHEAFGAFHFGQPVEDDAAQIVGAWIRMGGEQAGQFVQIIRQRFFKLLAGGGKRKRTKHFVQSGIRADGGEAAQIREIGVRIGLLEHQQRKVVCGDLRVETVFAAFRFARLEGAVRDDDGVIVWEGGGFADFKRMEA